jgi:predicted NAD/FAD-dependent oxidoreductase
LGKDILHTEVCIIGGGIAGLSTAYRLKKKGVSSIVLDKSDRLGEKTRSLSLDGNTVELGTCYMSYDYQRVFELADDLGIKRFALGKASSFGEGSIAQAILGNRFKQITYLLANSLRIRKYCKIREHALTGFDSGDSQCIKDLSQPMLDWLRENNLASLQPIFTILGDCYGYGPMDRTPALYVMRFVTSGIMKSMITQNYWGLEKFEQVLIELGNRLNVRQCADFTGGKFDDVDQSWQINDGEAVIKCNHVVIACPPDSPELLNLLDAERSATLDGALISTPYMCATVKVRNWFSEDVRSTLRSVGALDQVSFVRKDSPVKDGMAYYACFAMLSDHTMDVRPMLEAAIISDGGDVEEIIQANIYPTYNLHFTSAALLEGRQNAMHKAQGAQNLWIVNSILAHENWRDLTALGYGVADAISSVESSR